MLKKILIYFISLPKSFYASYKCFGINGMFKLPMLVKYNTKIGKLSFGCIRTESPIRTGIFRFGFSDGSYDRGRGMKCFLNVGGVLHIKNYAYFANGCVLSVNSGDTYLGNNFQTNYGFFLSCNKKIVFGDDCAIGWNCSLFDADGHSIVSSDGKKNIPSEIYIGNHVWLCAETTVLKGTSISDGSVVAFGTIVSGKHNDENSLLTSSICRSGKRISSWSK